VKSIRLGDVDVLNGGLRLLGAPAGQLEIVIGTAPGALEGSVFNDSQTAGPGVSVVLLPDVRRRTDLYKTTTTDPSGRFRIDRVPPGDYRAFAWQEISEGAWLDPDFMQGQEARGTPVRVVEAGATPRRAAGVVTLLALRGKPACNVVGSPGSGILRGVAVETVGRYAGDVAFARAAVATRALQERVDAEQRKPGARMAADGVGAVDDMDCDEGRLSPGGNTSGPSEICPAPGKTSQIAVRTRSARHLHQ
jgi:hypothetical protein